MKELLNKPHLEHTSKLNQTLLNFKHLTRGFGNRPKIDVVLKRNKPIIRFGWGVEK